MLALPRTSLVKIFRGYGFGLLAGTVFGSPISVDFGRLAGKRRFSRPTHHSNARPRARAARMLARIRSFFGNSQSLAVVDPNAGAVVDPGQPSRALSASVASRARSQSPEWLLIAEHDLARDLAADLSSIRPDADISGKIKAIAEGHTNIPLHAGRMFSCAQACASGSSGAR